MRKLLFGLLSLVITMGAGAQIIGFNADAAC